jgi:hypothetical protein
VSKGIIPCKNPTKNNFPMIPIKYQKSKTKKDVSENTKWAFHLKCLEMKCKWNTYQSEHFIWNALKWNANETPIKASISFEMPWNEMWTKHLSKRAFHLKCLEMKCEQNTYQCENFIWNALKWNACQSEHFVWNNGNPIVISPCISKRQYYYK